MLKRLSFISLISLWINCAYADFNYDAGLGFISVDEDGSSEGFLLGGSYYFNTVSTSHGPLGAAVFLDKSSFVRANLTEVTNGDSIVLSSRFLLARKTILELDYTDTDFTDFSFSLGLGKYLTDTSSIIASYREGDDDDVFSVRYKSFQPITNYTSWSYDVGGAYVSGENGSGPSISGEFVYYPSSVLGLGFTVGFSEAGESDTNEFGINGQYFFRSDVSGTFSFQTQDVDGGDIDVITLGVEARF